MLSLFHWKRRARELPNADNDDVDARDGGGAGGWRSMTMDAPSIPCGGSGKCGLFYALPAPPLAPVLSFIYEFGIAAKQQQLHRWKPPHRVSGVHGMRTTRSDR